MVGRAMVRRSEAGSMDRMGDRAQAQNAVELHRVRLRRGHERRLGGPAWVGAAGGGPRQKPLKKAARDGRRAQTVKPGDFGMRSGTNRNQTERTGISVTRDILRHSDVRVT